MRIYLDTSVYNRPFDDQTQARISLETLAYTVILQMIESGAIELASSTMLEYENSRNPFALRKRAVSYYLTLASYHQTLNGSIRQRAQEMEQQGLKAMDALHLACAEAAGCEFFLTCDDQVVRRGMGKIRVLNPVDFVLTVTGGS